MLSNTCSRTSLYFSSIVPPVRRESTYQPMCHVLIQRALYSESEWQRKVQMATPQEWANPCIFMATVYRFFSFCGVGGHTNRSRFLYLSCITNGEVSLNEWPYKHESPWLNVCHFLPFHWTFQAISVFLLAKWNRKEINEGSYKVRNFINI